MEAWTMGKIAPPYKPSLLANLRHAPARVAAAVAGLSDDEIHATPIPGKWSVRECIEHIVKVDLGWTDILYEAVSPYHPELRQYVPNWHEAAKARLVKSLPDALNVLRQNHVEVMEYLEQLPEPAFVFEHRPVQWMVQAKIPFVIKESVNWGLSVHPDHHLIHIHAKRQALGKPLDWMADIRTD